MFASPTAYLAGSGPRAVAAGDLDGDGTPDLVVANSTGQGMSVLLNFGHRLFAAPTSYSLFYDVVLRRRERPRAR